MERRMRSGAPRELRDARARLIELAARYGTDTLGTPSRFFPAPPPAEIREKRVAEGVVDLSFPSTYVPFVRSYADEHERWRENLTAHARLWTRGGGLDVGSDVAPRRGEPGPAQRREGRRLRRAARRRLPRPRADHARADARPRAPDDRRRAGRSHHAARSRRGAARALGRLRDPLV